MMRLEVEWHSTPEEGDLLECRTWARLIWRAGPHILTRAHDRRARGERDGIFIPLYPLARWFVSNWWSLLYETWPAGEIPPPGRSTTPDIDNWLYAHCARAALSGYAFPYVCIVSRGRDVGILSRSDPRGRYTRTPVEFTENAEWYCDRYEVSRVLAGFIDDVLTHLAELGYSDERTEALRSDWAAIRSPGASEAEFCRAAGRLGLDPYETSTWSASVLNWFIHSQPGELDRAFASDLLEAPDPTESKPRRYAAFRSIVDEFALSPAAQNFGPALSDPTAHEEGYGLARWIRQSLGLALDQKLEDLRDASRAACNREMRVVESTNIPSGRVLAAVGWMADPGPTVIARPSPKENTRFLWGRGLYLALRGATGGPRLVTDARTWEQRGSRAFSAELLAPQDGVVPMYRIEESEIGRDAAMAKVAAHYGVSSMVIEHQLNNAMSIDNG